MYVYEYVYVYVYVCVYVCLHVLVYVYVYAYVYVYVYVLPQSGVHSPPGPRQFIGSFVGLYAFPCARASKSNQQYYMHMYIHKCTLLTWGPLNNRLQNVVILVTYNQVH